MTPFNPYNLNQPIPSSAGSSYPHLELHNQSHVRSTPRYNPLHPVEQPHIYRHQQQQQPAFSYVPSRQTEMSPPNYPPPDQHFNHQPPTGMHSQLQDTHIDSPTHVTNPYQQPPFQVQQNPTSQPFISNESRVEMPKLGQTRCYWTLLSPELKFLYLDPVLQAHMSAQGNLLPSRCILDFVHPEEKQSARNDLLKTLENKALTGSVTRVRMLRLTVIRQVLGALPEQCSTFPEAEHIAYDKEYLTCHLVINWAAEGVVLCFIHALVDISPLDNDERLKTPWTNWCGTAVMNNEHAHGLRLALTTLAQPTYPYSTPSSSQLKAQLADRPLDRVFQILRNGPVNKRPVLVSWPPEEYHTVNLGELAEAVNLETQRSDTSSANDVSNSTSHGPNSGASTSCTRRFRVWSGPEATKAPWEVESIYVPHGSIVFACHSLTRAQLYTHSAPETQPAGYQHHVPRPLAHHSQHPSDQYGYSQFDPHHPPTSHTEPGINHPQGFQQDRFASQQGTHYRSNPEPHRQHAEEITYHHRQNNLPHVVQQQTGSVVYEGVPSGMGQGRHDQLQHQPWSTHPPESHISEQAYPRQHHVQPMSTPSAPDQPTYHGYNTASVAHAPQVPAHQPQRQNYSQNEDTYQSWYQRQNYIHGHHQKSSAQAETPSPATSSMDSATTSFLSSTTSNHPSIGVPAAIPSPGTLLPLPSTTRTLSDSRSNTSTAYLSPDQPTSAQPPWSVQGGPYTSPSGSTPHSSVNENASLGPARADLPSSSPVAEYRTTYGTLHTIPSSNLPSQSTPQSHHYPGLRAFHNPHPGHSIPIPPRAGQNQSANPPASLPRIRTDFQNSGSALLGGTRSGNSNSVDDGEASSNSPDQNQPYPSGTTGSFTPSSTSDPYPQYHAATHENQYHPRHAAYPSQAQSSTSPHLARQGLDSPTMHLPAPSVNVNASSGRITHHKERETCGSRAGGKPPPGVEACASCGGRNSPEWRKGQTGKKDLCNACGLRYARSKQKKEGHVTAHRKRKDGTVAKQSKKLKSHENEPERGIEGPKVETGSLSSSPVPPAATSSAAASVTANSVGSGTTPGEEYSRPHTPPHSNLMSVHSHQPGHQQAMYDPQHNLEELSLEGDLSPHTDNTQLLSPAHHIHDVTPYFSTSQTESIHGNPDGESFTASTAIHQSPPHHDEHYQHLHSPHLDRTRG